MKQVEQYTGTLVVLGRLRNSYHGNPRFLCMLVRPSSASRWCTTVSASGDGIVFVTMPDSAYAYAIENLRGEEVNARIGWHRGRLQLASIEKV